MHRGSLPHSELRSVALYRLLPELRLALQDERAASIKVLRALFFAYEVPDLYHESLEDRGIEASPQSLVPQPPFTDRSNAYAIPVH